MWTSRPIMYQCCFNFYRFNHSHGDLHLVKSGGRDPIPKVKCISRFVIMLYDDEVCTNVTKAFLVSCNINNSTCGSLCDNHIGSHLVKHFLRSKSFRCNSETGTWQCGAGEVGFSDIHWTCGWFSALD